MKAKVLVKSLLMGAICPAAIYLAAAVLDVITQESRAALFVMFIEGVLLFLLPVFFLRREKELNEQFPTKLTAPAYLLAYAVITLVMIYITDSVDMEKLFHGRYLGGIGLVFMYTILIGGFVWAVVFRVGALIVRALRSSRE
jgi:hypothetical protein